MALRNHIEFFYNLELFSLDLLFYEILAPLESNYRLPNQN